MNRNIRREYRIGIIVYMLALTLGGIDAPCFIIGALHGLAISFLLVSILPEERYQALKRWKKALLKRG